MLSWRITKLSWVRHWEKLSQQERASSSSKPKRTVDVDALRRWRRRGKYAEQQLVNLLEKHGWKAIRIPLSGPAMKYPDVFATKGDRIAAFEVKYHYQSSITVAEEQVAKLFNFLEMFKPYKSREAVIAAKFGRRWVFKHVKSIGKVHVSSDEKSDWSII
ncbi:MAG: hypothetical protein DRJ33_03945 [Candidatus Methanomethylicota archaeon]|uniref:Endonuclease n=1 Tax=Thermoproteota archaeon TaxID=2056631 RepID=A0A497EYZ2_9CREN|nr:MAG: hypothetical protein DRJ33_03945 [Candidatus Verstraetearchaeota archaeon]